jgi:hypothetical protein
MNIYLPPSRDEVTAHDIERFNALYRRIRNRLAPGNLEEESMCNEVIVALWHHRCFRNRSQMFERQLRQAIKQAAKPDEITALRRQLSWAQRHAKIQKNFAWRRRNKYFAVKTIREQQARMPIAA